MATDYTLPPPPPLEIHDPQAAEKWKKFRLAWNSYALATGLNDKTEPVQVATLLTVIGEEAREVFSTFTEWDSDGDQAKIQPVLKKFEQYCEPHRNVLFERYRFNRRIQEAGETYDQYIYTVKNGVFYYTHVKVLHYTTEFYYTPRCINIILGVSILS